MASGIWCFVIGLHTFASVILDYRLSKRAFYSWIVLLWVFIYGIALIGVGMYGKELYVRSGIWVSKPQAPLGILSDKSKCWIHHDLQSLRLWLHYFWIFVFEFGNVFVYVAIYTILLTRIRSDYYTETEAKRVKAISNLMVVYPVVYVICTIPLASARMAAMGGHPPSHARLCLAAAMITSNGWLDVLLYTLTRRIMVFSDEPPPDDNGIDTFAFFWAEKPRRFGGTWTVETGTRDRPTSRTHRVLGSLSIRNESEDDLVHSAGNIKLVKTTHVVSEPAQPEDYEEIEELQRQMQPRTPVRRWSEDSGTLTKDGKEVELAHIPSMKSLRSAAPSSKSGRTDNSWMPKS